MKRFKKFYIEITNVCNLSCDFCPKTMRKPEFMKVETFRSILDQIKEYTDHLYFHVKGEPFLHPKLEEFLDICYEKGFQVNITTNGTLLHQVHHMLMTKPALRQINFSLHSFDGNEGGDNKEEYGKQIMSFAKEATEKSNVIIALRLWNLEKNDVVNLQEKKNNEMIALIEKEFALPYQIKEHVEQGRGIKIANRIFLNQDYLFQWPDLKECEDDGKGFCYGLRDQIGILVDGTVIPCCLDGEGVINLGNIHSTSFREIVESEKVQHIVDGFSRREAVEELCRKCGFRKRFGKSKTLHHVELINKEKEK